MAKDLYEILGAARDASGLELTVRGHWSKLRNATDMRQRAAVCGAFNLMVPGLLSRHFVRAGVQMLPREASSATVQTQD